MANTSSRTLRLLSLLQTHRYWPGTELAERMGVSARTLRRDIDRLRELGYPVHAQRGVEGGYQLAAGAALPPLVLDDEEAVAIAVGLRAAANGMVEGIAETSVRALAKVTQVMPSRLRRRVEALTAMTVPEPLSTQAGAVIAPEILTGVALACRDNERVRFGYAAAGGKQTSRHVEPHRLVSLGRRWYLVGYDLDRNDWRSFRLDRMTEQPDSTGARFRPRELPAADAAEFVRSGIRERPAGCQAEVIFEAPAAAIVASIGRWATVEDTGDGRCLARINADTVDWAVTALGVTNARFTLLGPQQVADRVADWAARFAAATAQPSDRLAGVGFGGGFRF
jgi:predicted DNA-binding transcriptional regulator YafY